MVRCKGCGRFRPVSLASTGDRTPCPHCGRTVLVIGASAHLTGEGTLTALSSLLPGDQTQGWERRWRDIEGEAAELLRPITVPMSGETIQAARQRVQSFFVTAYHLKDNLVRSSATTGIARHAVENAVSGDPDLALLCDLANLLKHGQLNRPPRSGYVPSVLSWAGTFLPGASPSWRLDLVIEHNGVMHDGLDLVKRSVAAWRRTLQGWNLI
jgi:hypothetical protein